MIALLRGRLLERDQGSAIVDAGGVGYEVWSPARTLDAWGLVDGEITAHVSTQVREDAITLYGFATRRDRTAFEVLLSVSGVGPKTALAALDTLAVDQLARAVDTDDLMTLAKIPGVGKKSAQRLALELKGKLPVEFSPVAAATAAGAKRKEADMLPLALARLEYGRAEIDKALRALEEQGLGPDANLQLRLSAALRVLAAKPS